MQTSQQLTEVLRETIRTYQKEHGFDKMQAIIDSGAVWGKEPHLRDKAIECIKSGACMLPKSYMLGYTTTIQVLECEEVEVSGNIVTHCFGYWFKLKTL